MIKISMNIKMVTFFLLLPFFIQAQNSDFGNWLIYIGSKKINSNWNIHNEIQYRNYNAVGDLEQLLLRTGLGYSFNEKNNNILIGYGYILSENYLADNKNKISINEHRVFQQFISKQSIGAIKLNHRYRFEQRFVGKNFKIRFRYFLGFQFPIIKSKTDKNIYLSAYNEIFLNTKSQIFDRNRLYGGIGFNINKKLRMEIGYMNQFFETFNRDQLNIITFVNF